MNIQTKNMRKPSQNIRAFNNKLFEKQNFYKQNQNEIKYDSHRPAQAISFSGSAVSLAQKGITKAADSIAQNGPEIAASVIKKSGSESAWHKLINFVYDNEAAYTAIYSLIVAGMLKPICVLNMKGSEEKDKQIVATKNFIQAFIGSFLGFTIGGGLVKKSVDVIKNNMKLITMNDQETAFKITDDAGVLTKMAKDSLKKEKDGFLTKFRYVKDTNQTGIFGAAWQALTKKAVVAENMPKDLNPDKQIFINISEFDIKDKITQLKKTAQGHLHIFNNPKNIEYVKRLKNSGNEKVLLAQKDSVMKSILDGANASTVKEQYKSLVSSILDNSAASYTETITKKAKELEGLLTKEKAQEALDSLFDFIKDKKAHETLMETYETVWKSSSGSVTGILKAIIAGAMLPTVMAALFAKRNARKQMEKEAKQSAVLLNSPMYKKEQENYSAITNKSVDNKANNQVSFTGGLDNVIDKFAMGVESLSVTKLGQGLVNVIHNLPKPLNKTSARMGDLESFLITGYWVQNTLRSKRIDPDQKLGLNVHTVLVTVVSSICAFAIDTLLDPLITMGKNKYTQKLTETAKEALESKNIEETVSQGCKDLLCGKNASKKIIEVLKDNSKKFFDANGKLIQDSELDSAIKTLTGTYGKMLTKFKSLTVFTLVVRFLVPVLMVPYSGKLKKHIQKKQQEKNSATNTNKAEVKK